MYPKHKHNGKKKKRKKTTKKRNRSFSVHEKTGGKKRKYRVLILWNLVYVLKSSLEKKKKGKKDKLEEKRRPRVEGFSVPESFGGNLGFWFIQKLVYLCTQDQGENVEIRKNPTWN